jgi:hypothetical protein
LLGEASICQIYVVNGTTLKALTHTNFRRLVDLRAAAQRACFRLAAECRKRVQASAAPVKEGHYQASQLAASFISGQACDVAFWHKAEVLKGEPDVRFRGGNADIACSMCIPNL